MLGVGSNVDDGRLVAAIVMTFYFLLPNLDLVLLLLVCACTQWWLVVADLCLHFQVSMTIQTLENILLKVFYYKIFYL